MDGDFHIVTVARGGAVSILKNLDETTAIETYRRLRPDMRPIEYVTDETLAAVRLLVQKGNIEAEMFNGGWSYCSDGDLVKVEILCPEGVRVNPHDGWEPVKIAKPPVIYYDKAGNEYTRKEAFEFAFKFALGSE